MNQQDTVLPGTNSQNLVSLFQKQVPWPKFIISKFDGNQNSWEAFEQISLIF